MPIGLLKDWPKGRVAHDRCSKSTRTADLLTPSVNIAHVARSPAFPPSSFRKLLHQSPKGWQGFRTNVDTTDPEAGVSRLLQDFAHVNDVDTRSLLQFLSRDICEITELFHTDLGISGDVNVKLQPITSTTCPKYHADTVKMRCLCTYMGQGTWFIENRHVKRTWMVQGSLPWDPAAISVNQVDEEYAVQAQPGDLLFLKGHLWPGNYGLGAVHRSPSIDTPDLGHEEQVRLMLTVDDAVTCPCGEEH